VPPQEEQQHLAALQQATQGKLADANMQTAILAALDTPSRSSPQFAAAAVEWAQRVAATQKTEDADEDEDEAWMSEQSVVSAATITMRDGAAELRAGHHAWAHGVFAQALRAKEDPVVRFRSGLRYNPVAIAFVGMIHSLKDRAAPEEVRALLEASTRGEPAAAHGFDVAATTLAAIDERLLRAVLRCAFAACIRPHCEWGIPEEKVTARLERHRQRVQAAVDAEMTWLANERPEPDWPAFLADAPRLRRHLRLQGGRIKRDEPTRSRSRPEEYADHQAAAVWLSQCRNLVDMVKRPWLRDMARAYASWTAEVNGVRLDASEEVENPPREWNDAYFELLARCMPGLALPEIEQLALVPISSLPDRSFFDILPPFLRTVDIAYFNDRALDEPIAIGIRFKLANRLMASSGWKLQQRRRSASIETHIGPAIAVLFFNDYGFAQPAKCYLLPGSIDRLPPFLPVLGKLAEGGPSHFVAILTLNLIEVSPRLAHLRFIVTAAKAWMQSYTKDTEFWVDYGIGRRICVWIEDAYRQEPALLTMDDAVRSDVDRLLAALINLGVPEARRLEKALSKE
jgi:hypothetical protein